MKRIFTAFPMRFTRRLRQSTVTKTHGLSSDDDKDEVTTEGSRKNTSNDKIANKILVVWIYIT